jgi:hypothetical protein
MPLADRDHVVRATGRDTTTHAQELTAGILLAALAAALAIRHLVPIEALAPAVVTLLFAGAAVTAGIALLCRRGRFGIMWLELAGGLTFVGVVLSVLIEPDQLVRLTGVSSQPE